MKLKFIVLGKSTRTSCGQCGHGNPYIQNADNPVGQNGERSKDMYTCRIRGSFGSMPPIGLKSPKLTLCEACVLSFAKEVATAASDLRQADAQRSVRRRQERVQANPAEAPS